ncbi:MAG: GGDEF domain-containing protein [Oceanococcaceae bacterium]
MTTGISAAAQRDRGFRRLRFDDVRLERRFRREYSDDRIGMVRLGLLVASALYTLYIALRLQGPMDTLLLQTTALRCLIVGSMLLATFAYPRVRRPLRELVMVLVYLNFTVCVTTIEHLTNAAEGRAHYEGILFIVFHVFLFGGLRFWRALMLVLGIITVYGAGMLLTALASDILGFQLFFIGLTAALGGGAQYLVENSAREAWLRQNELEHIANTDTVTGLANRGAFERQVRQQLRRAEQSQEGLCLILVDIDHFKRVNDVFGHAVGDRMLHAVGQAMLVLGEDEGDITARWGGDELVALWHCCRRELLAQRLERLRELCHLAGQRILYASHDDDMTRASVSVGGVITVPDRPLRFEDLLRAADQQLYAAKRGGRDGWRLAEYPVQADTITA